MFEAIALVEMGEKMSCEKTGFQDSRSILAVSIYECYSAVLNSESTFPNATQTTPTAKINVVLLRDSPRNRVDAIIVKNSCKIQPFNITLLFLSLESQKRFKCYLQFGKVRVCPDTSPDRLGQFPRSQLRQ